MNSILRVKTRRILPEFVRNLFYFDQFKPGRNNWNVKNAIGQTTQYYTEPNGDINGDINASRLTIPKHLTVSPSFALSFDFWHPQNILNLRLLPTEELLAHQVRVDLAQFFILLHGFYLKLIGFRGRLTLESVYSAQAGCSRKLFCGTMYVR